MYTTHGSAEVGQTTASTRAVSNFLRNCWDSFQQRRKRDRLRAELCGLNDYALTDIGITRGEIDYVLDRPRDPRGQGLPC
jgi:uncharacterized protein YjiS (DUF1127 family)